MHRKTRFTLCYCRRWAWLAGFSVAAFLSCRSVEAGPSVAPSHRPGVTLPFQVRIPGRGFLSLGVYNNQDTLIRSLACAKPVQAGSLRLGWDATTDLGVPVAPGRYHVRGVFFAHPVHVKYIMKVGESGNPPYTLSDGLGGWGGCLGGPEAVCSNGKQVVGIFGCVENPLNTGVQRMNAAGKILGRYYTFFPWDVRLAGALTHRHFYLADTWFAGRRLVIGKYDIDASRGKILANIPVGNHFSKVGSWQGNWICDVEGLAVNAGRIYVPVLLDNRLFVVDAHSGKILDRVSISSPRGVAVYHGHIFLLSGTKLVELGADGAVRRTVITAGLEDPIGLAIDLTGNFYITDRSRPQLHKVLLMQPPADFDLPNRGGAQQVKVFSPQGQLIRTIGIKGGRPRNGLYDPAGLLDPRGICIGPGGNVWVASPAEDYQRISVWNGQSGALEKEFFNTRISSGQGKLSPSRKDMIFRHNDYADSPGVTAYRIHLKKGTWYPVWHESMAIGQMTQPKVLIGNNHIFGRLVKPFHDQVPYLSFAGGMVHAVNGKTYLCGGSFSIWVLPGHGRYPHLVSLVYMHRVSKLPDGRYKAHYQQGPDDWFTWSDVHDTGRMSLDGVRYTVHAPGMAKISRPLSWQLQPDLSILMLCPVNQGMSHGQWRPFKWVIKKLAPRKILPDGVPIYDWADVKTIARLKVPSYVSGRGAWKGGASTTLSELNMRGGGYNLWSQPRMAPGVNLMLPGIDGDGWWASRNWRNSPMRFNDAGIPAWLKLGRRASGMAKPGEMYYPWTVETDINGFCFVNDCISQTWVWTDHGLYIGHLYHDPRKQIRDGNSVFVESIGGYTYKIHGKVYNFMGDHGVFVHQVLLPKLTPIHGGTIVVTPTMAAAARSWDPDGPPPGKRPVYLARSIWNFVAQRQAAMPGHRQGNFHTRHITIDGKLTTAEWGGVKPMILKLHGKVVATVKTLFGAENLYLAYQVKDPYGFKNAGTELPDCPFTSGSYVSFAIGRNWNHPQRMHNDAGDVRVILARITGGRKPFKYQMAFWPVYNRKPAHPQTITSPAASRHFDNIAPYPGLKWAYRLIPGGYTVEVKVPLRPLKIYHPAQPIGFDVAVGFANRAGTVRQAAVCWDGQTESMVVDRPSSAALLPQTWGTLVFERSPVLGATIARR